MSKDPAFPFYASDWLGSNKRAMMTLEQQAAYIILLCRQWASADCLLPDDDEVLAKLSEMNEGWLKGGSQLVRDCFEPIANHPGKIGNVRLREVRAERDKWREKSRQGGKKSGKSRRAKSIEAGTYVVPKGKTKGGSTTVPTKHEPNTNTPSPSPSPSPSIKTKPVLIPKALNTLDFAMAWKEFKVHRKDTKKPFTASMQRKMLVKLEEWGVDRAIAAIDNSIANGYQGIFEDNSRKGRKNETGGRYDAKSEPSTF